MRSASRGSHVLALLILCVFLAASRMAAAHGTIPRTVPVDRLIANLTQYIKDHPNDPEGYYRLGRVHMLALETKSELVLAFEGGEPDEPAEGLWASPGLRRDDEKQEATPEQLRTHLTEAVRYLNQAIERRPIEARYRLTLACTLEAGEPMIDEVDVWPLAPIRDALVPGASMPSTTIDGYRERFEEMAQEHGIVDELIGVMTRNTWTPTDRDVVMTLAYESRERPELKDAVKKLRAADWHEQIEHQFFTAMCYALPENGKASTKPMWGGLESWVSYEAGKDFIRVVQSREARPHDVIRLRVAKETVKAFEDLPRPGGITPIVFDFAGRPLSELHSSKTSSFDLDGSHRAQSWSWLKPDVGILAWDPERTGRITSGRQLFGSVTWWLFFENGYQALDTLDDNRDGELAGPELEGLAVWFDRNENGAADAGEVKPIEQLEIAAIACRATGLDGASPANPTGLRMNDGRVLPTFDWVVTSQSDSSPR